MESGKIKSGSALFSPDKHKTIPVRRNVFAFLLGLACDLEGLGAEAGLKKCKR
jgi:hypothetical protein